MKKIIYLNKLVDQDYPDHIKICFKRDCEIIEKLKHLPFAFYSNKHKCYIFKNSNENITFLQNHFKGFAELCTHYLFRLETKKTYMPTTLGIQNKDKKQGQVPVKTSVLVLPLEHEQKGFLIFQYKHNWQVYNAFRDNTTAKWSKTYKRWVIHNDIKELLTLMKAMRDTAYFNISKLISIQDIDCRIYLMEQRLDYTRQRGCPREYMEKLVLLNYSPNTASVYHSLFVRFINHFRNKTFEELNIISTEEINKYHVDMIERNSVSASYINQSVNAIKFYYEKVLGGERQYYNIGRPGKEDKLPIMYN